MGIPLSSRNTRRSIRWCCKKSILYVCVTGYSDANCIYDYILPYITNINDESKTIDYYHNKVKVIFNGRWIGVTEDPIHLYKELKEKKYKDLFIYTRLLLLISMKNVFIFIMIRVDW